jgi:hypothetical protein
MVHRDAPLSDHSGVLKVADDGVLVLLNSTKGIVWSSNTSKTAENPVTQLLDTGNLVVKDGNVNEPKKFMWQSFDYPCDTLLPGMKLGFVLNEKEVYYESKLLNTSVFARYVLNPSGMAQRFVWKDRTQSWELFSTSQADRCDHYALCGGYATCNINKSPVCSCLEGFIPKSPKDWDSADWSDGCVRRTPLECNDGDRFLKRTRVKLPDTSSSWYNKSMTLKECEGMCLKNCSCTAYASLDIRGGGSGCLLWFGSLIDTREFTEGGQDLYIRMAATELGTISLLVYSLNFVVGFQLAKVAYYMIVYFMR